MGSIDDVYAKTPELSRKHSLDCGSPIRNSSKTDEISTSLLSNSRVSTMNTINGRATGDSRTRNVDLTPEELAEVVVVKATEELRTNGLAFMEQEGNTFRSLEDFRRAFNGANGPTLDSDDENGCGGGESGAEVDESGTSKKRKKIKTS